MFPDCSGHLNPKTYAKRLLHHQTPLHLFPPRMDRCPTQFGEFEFDSVHEEGTSQSEVYGGSIEPLVNTFLAGESVAVLVYGARGTGKTFTLKGGGSEGEGRGMVQRAVEAVMRGLEGVPRDSFSLRVSFTGNCRQWAGPGDPGGGMGGSL